MTAPRTLSQILETMRFQPRTPKELREWLRREVAKREKPPPKK